MGGRMASLVAAEGFACDALVFWGYPLHPAVRPSAPAPAALRDEHLPRVEVPMLFVQGTRDALCRLELLRPVLRRLGARATLHVVEGADHGFDVLRSSGRTPEEVEAEIAGVVNEWLARIVR